MKRWDHDLNRWVECTAAELFAARERDDARAEIEDRTSLKRDANNGHGRGWVPAHVRDKARR
jgi:hypothetical protein